MATSIDMKGQRVVWGTTDLGTPVANGICVSGVLTSDFPNDDTEDEEGRLVGLTFYDERWSGTLEVVCKEGCAAPGKADAVSVGGKTLYVTQCSQRWQNKGKKQLSVSLKGGSGIAAGGGQ